MHEQITQMQESVKIFYRIKLLSLARIPSVKWLEKMLHNSTYTSKTQCKIHNCIIISSTPLSCKSTSFQQILIN